MSQVKCFIRIMLVSFIYLLLISCSSETSTSNYSITIDADTKINKNYNGKSAPVQITVYALKSSQEFNKSDYISLIQTPKERLKDDLVYMESLTIEPGNQKTLALKLLDSTKFIGVVVGFKDLDNSSWKAIIDKQKLASWMPFVATSVRIRLDNSNIIVNDKR